jgi:hypothetical protein
MLRHAVLVVGMEEPSDHVCVVPVRPYPSPRQVLREVLSWPEDGGWKCIWPCRTLITRLLLDLLQAEDGLDDLPLVLLRTAVLVAV